MNAVTNTEILLVPSWTIKKQTKLEFIRNEEYNKRTTECSSKDIFFLKLKLRYFARRLLSVFFFLFCAIKTQ